MGDERLKFDFLKLLKWMLLDLFRSIRLDDPTTLPQRPMS
jgi:hypothetical protein